jgi:hypothetical protein
MKNNQQKEIWFPNKIRGVAQSLIGLFSLNHKIFWCPVEVE